MLNYHSDQFRVQFAQCPPELHRAPLVDLSLTLPEFEEQFNRPSLSQQDQGLGWLQVLGRRIGDNECPLCQFPLQGTDCLAFVSGLAGKPLPSKLCHFFGDAHHDQANGQRITLPQADVQDLDLPNGARQDAEQVDPLALPLPEDGIGLGVLAEAHLLRLERTQALQTPIAPVSDIQTARLKLLSELKQHLGTESCFCYPSPDKRLRREAETNELSLLRSIHDQEASEENGTWLCYLLLPNVPTYL